MTFKQAIHTRYSETGQDGIIHHSSYVVYLEVARIEFLKRNGININALETEKIFCPVVDLSLKYLKPLHSLEEVFIHVFIETFSRVRFSLNYQVLREEVCVAIGTTSHCFVNASFKPMPIPQDILEQFNQLTNKDEYLV